MGDKDLPYHISLPGNSLSILFTVQLQY